MGKKCFEDEWGPPGFRCDTHGGVTRCCVPMCYLQAKGFVEVDDGHVKGWRCKRHNGTQQKVLTQLNSEGKMVSLAFGVKPSRAPMLCCIEKCSRWGKSKAKEPDEYGPAGFRCRAHGGYKCNVEGCTRLKQGRNVMQPDEFGAPGIRCALHGGM